LTVIKKRENRFLSHPLGDLGQYTHSVYSSLESLWLTFYSSY